MRSKELLGKIIGEAPIPEAAPIHVDALLDALVALFDDSRAVELSTPTQLKFFINRYQPMVNKIKSLRLNKYDFQILKELAKGHFGMVSVVRCKADGKIYAMKTLNKLYILRCQELSFFMEEKTVLSLSKYSQWIPELYTSFQDSENLYLVMEYAGGGDLFNLLDRNSNPIISEDEAKFYLAEIILGLSDLHSLGFVHRDIKPQNIIIDNQGHIKLADFGSCIRLNDQGLVTSNIPVGTSDYISPEVLTAQEGISSYGVECDWWSVGILLYELLQGDPPFSSDNLLETHSQIMNHENNLMFHGFYPISETAKDLIKKLVCDREQRLGINGVDEIKQHPFFNGINWNGIRNQTPPFIPTLLTPDDTSNFSSYDGEQDGHNIVETYKGSQKDFLGNHLPFIGFTYQTYPKILFENLDSPSMSTLGGQSNSNFNSEVTSKVQLETKGRAYHTQQTQTDLTDNQLNDRSILDHESLTPSIKDDLVSDPISDQIIAELKYNIDSLKAGLGACQETVSSQKTKNLQLTQQCDQIREQLIASELEKNEMSQLMELLETKSKDDERDMHELKQHITSITQDKDKSQSEVRLLKQAITELTSVHQEMKEATMSLDQSREQADLNFNIMKDKCESLHYDNKCLQNKIEELEKKLMIFDDSRDDQLTSDLEESRHSFSKVIQELQEYQKVNKELTNDLEHYQKERENITYAFEDLQKSHGEINLKLSQTKQVNHELSLHLEETRRLNEELTLKLSETTQLQDTSSVGSVFTLDHKLYKDIVSNLEVESKNHHLLTSIYRDLQSQRDLQPALNDARESRDEAIQRADQMLRLNEKQANLIHTLMEKIQYLETLPNTGQSSSNSSVGIADSEHKLSRLFLENQSLKKSLSFKDQKLQEIVTKLVLAEASKPSFWPKSKDKHKERQRVLLHSIQTLEQKLRLVERENSQLRFINQMTRSEASPTLDINEEMTVFTDDTHINEHRGFSHLLFGPESPRPMSMPVQPKDPSSQAFGQTLMRERSLSTKYGIAHIK